MPNLELTRPRPDIVIVTLDRPEKLNALNYELVEDLHRTLDQIRQMTSAASSSSPAGAGVSVRDST